jgi:hypothetical protein
VASPGVANERRRINDKDGLFAVERLRSNPWLNEGDGDDSEGCKALSERRNRISNALRYVGNVHSEPRKCHYFKLKTNCEMSTKQHVEQEEFISEAANIRDIVTQQTTTIHTIQF